MDFNSVWSRVAAASSVSAGPAELIEALAADEMRDAAYYSALASKTSSLAARRLLCSLAADENRHVRLLRPVYYLLTGGELKPTAGRVSLPPSLLDALRLRHGSELSAAEKYGRAAAALPEPGSAKLFASIADEERRHAGELRRLIEKCF